MRHALRQRIALLAAALWWGSLSTLGFLVVPMLFAQLGNPPTAGAMAAKLFSAQTGVSLCMGLLMLMALQPSAGVAQAADSNSQSAGKPESKTAVTPVNTALAAMFLIVSGMLLALLVEFAVAPRIVSARATGGNLRLWHGLGTAMYVGQWLCALLLLWRQSKAPSAPATGP